MKTLKVICLSAIISASLPVHAGLLDQFKDIEKIDKVADIANNLKSGNLNSDALIKDLVDKKCRSELNDRQEWQVISMFMSDEKKREWEDKVCGCATEETVNATDKKDIAKIINPSTREKTVATITGKAVKACIARLR